MNTTTIPIKLISCIKCKYKQNANICKSHNPYFIYNTTQKINQMFKLRKESLKKKK